MNGVLACTASVTSFVTDAAGRQHACRDHHAFLDDRGLPAMRSTCLIVSTTTRAVARRQAGETAA
jgi:hypothetical protein